LDLLDFAFIRELGSRANQTTTIRAPAIRFLFVDAGCRKAVPRTRTPADLGERISVARFCGNHPGAA
jgi:hypothetical protein